MRTVSAWCNRRSRRADVRTESFVEEAGPLLVDAICGEKGSAVLVAVADDLEQAVGTKLVDGQVAQFVDAQNLGFDVVVQRALDAAAGLRRRLKFLYWSMRPRLALRGNRPGRRWIVAGRSSPTPVRRLRSWRHFKSSRILQ